MKILYAIQGTGNGHLARATALIPEFEKYGDTDILVSGIQSDLDFPFEVKYQLYGLSFFFGNKGGVNIFKTIRKFRLFRFLYDIITLPVHEYDIVLSDFEPVTSWACLLKGKKCIGISHQNAVLDPKYPLPEKKDLIGAGVLKHYAPAAINLGFHFQPLGHRIFTPIIREDVRNANPTPGEHYTVYLPAFSDDEISKVLNIFPEIQWEVFSKKCKTTYVRKNITFHPVSLRNFTKSMVKAKGVLTAAGFETPAEAIYLGKKLCVVPMKNQFEQQCNAALLKSMGIMVLNNFKSEYRKITDWLNEEEALQMMYVDNKAAVAQKVVQIWSDEEEHAYSAWIFNLWYNQAVRFKLVAQRNAITMKEFINNLHLK